MVQYRKKGSAFSASEIDRFLGRVELTGNFTLAAEFIGRPVRSLHGRRRRDPEFAARCEIALARFRIGGAAAARSTPVARKRAIRAAGDEWVAVRGGPGGRTQLRRAKRGQIARDGFALFLRTVAATANIDLSARSIGVASSTIDYHRKRDVAFDQLVTEAMKQGVQRIETALIDSALRGVRGDEDEPAAGEAEPGWPEPPPLPPMTASEAFALLRKQQEQLSRPRKWSPERDRQTRALATARLEATMKKWSLVPANRADGDQRPGQTASPADPGDEAGPRVKRL